MAHKIFLKPLLLISLLFTVFTAQAAVDANLANVERLEAIRGLGPAKAKAIVAERSRGGPYKSLEDLAKRVKGIGKKSLQRLEKEGLSVGTPNSAVSGRPQTQNMPRPSTGPTRPR